METSLTVREADGMLSELAGGGHLAVESRDGALFYALPGRRSPRARRPVGAGSNLGAGLKLAPTVPVNLASRFSKNAVTPSLWSCV